MNLKSDHPLSVSVETTIVEAFEEHPEGYRPRIFTSTGKNVYELLQNGSVVPRPSLPPTPYTFDWWYLRIEAWSSMTMNRVETSKPEIPADVLQALKDAGVDVSTL